MTLILTILFAGPAGYLTRTRRLGLATYLVLWAIVFLIQTIVVRADNPDDIEPLYFVVNAVILATGIGLTELGSRLRERRRSHPAVESGETK